jgi:signal transduction histidine kinase
MMLDDLGLKPALEWLVQDFSHRVSMPYALVVDDAVSALETGVQSALYRAVQECLTNISRHAQATQVNIQIHMNGSSVNLQVHDNGIGINAEARGKRGSFGLIGMRERIYILGGTVAIDSLPGQGTHISIDLPLTSSAQDVLTS